jgi:integrase
MALHINDPRLVDAWLKDDAARLPSLPQYARSVRKLATGLGAIKLNALTEKILVDAVLCISAKRARTKTITAVGAFLKYLVRKRHLRLHPAPYFVETLKEVDADRALRDRLVEGGLESADATNLRWSDIAHVAFCRSPGKRGAKLMQLRNTPLGRELITGLLTELSHVQAEEISSVLSESIYRSAEQRK